MHPFCQYRYAPCPLQKRSDAEIEDCPFGIASFIISLGATLRTGVIIFVFIMKQDAFIGSRTCIDLKKQPIYINTNIKQYINTYIQQRLIQYDTYLNQFWRILPECFHHALPCDREGLFVERWMTHCIFQNTQR